jgi:hypothetical protein
MLKILLAENAGSIILSFLRTTSPGAIAQLGERRVRNAKAAGSIPAGSIEIQAARRCERPINVLDGELAVPCNPESALPGSNSHPRA